MRYQSINLARRLNSKDVLERPVWMFATRGVPEFLRSDTGSEFTAQAMRDRLAKVDVKTLCIEPGSPWENEYVESFHGKLPDELLNGEILFARSEARVLIERRRQAHNTVRPSSALRDRAPASQGVEVGAAAGSAPPAAWPDYGVGTNLETRTTRGGGSILQHPFNLVARSVDQRYALRYRGVIKEHL